MKGKSSVRRKIESGEGKKRCSSKIGIASVFTSRTSKEFLAILSYPMMCCPAGFLISDYRCLIVSEYLSISENAHKFESVHGNIIAAETYEEHSSKNMIVSCNERVRKT